MSNGCFEHHQPIITNACPTKRCQKSLHPKLVSIFPGVSKKKRERCHIVTSGFGRENFTKANPRTKTKALQKKKKKKKKTIQEQREVACTRAKTARSVSFSQILYILSKQELSYRWDVTCMFLDANQSETSSVNRTQY